MARDLELYIAGEWTPGSGDRVHELRSPVTGEHIANVPLASPGDIDRAVTAAREAQDEYRHWSAFERAELLLRVAEAVEENVEAIARIQTLEQGKPYHAESLDDIAEANQYFSNAAEDVKRLEGRVIPTSDRNKRMFTFHRPVGVWAAITPWNFPVTIPLEYVGPALAAGNAVIVKPPEFTCWGLLELAKAFDAAGVPKGLVSVIPGGADIGERLVTHDGIDGIGFTGSSATGRTIISKMGIKRSIMEMSGNGPTIVTDDANIDAAADLADDRDAVALVDHAFLQRAGAILGPHDDRASVEEPGQDLHLARDAFRQRVNVGEDLQKQQVGVAPRGDVERDRPDVHALADVVSGARQDITDAVDESFPGKQLYPDSADPSIRGFRGGGHGVGPRRGRLAEALLPAARAANLYRPRSGSPGRCVMRPLLPPAVACLLVAVAVAGCLTGPPEGLETPTGLPRLAVAGSVVEGSAPAVWSGARLAGEGMVVMPGTSRAPDCTPSSCERMPFRVDVPDGYWEEHPGHVEVSIEWEHQEHDYSSVTTDAIPMGHYLGLPNLFMHLRVLDADGNLIQDGVDAFHFASLALLPELPSGDYIAEIHAQWGEGTYTGVVQIEPLPTPTPGDQLPDLVIMPPSELTLEHPIGREGPDPVQPLGRKGCDPDEAAEGGAVRCLRFATGFGNLGPGRLEMHLSSDEAQQATIGEGQWVQHVFDHTGDHREHAAAPAQYHKVHGHYHILGLDVSTVYQYDLDSQTRGEPIGAGHKTGFCPVDSALVQPLGLGTSYPTAYGGCCYMWGFCQLDYVGGGEYQVGLSPGWYDVYPWWRADQYVDIGNAADGVYELETCANPDGHMVETRDDNNCASAVFRLTGNDVEILDSWSDIDPPEAQ